MYLANLRRSAKPAVLIFLNVLVRICLMTFSPQLTSILLLPCQCVNFIRPKLRSSNTNLLQEVDVHCFWPSFFRNPSKAAKCSSKMKIPSFTFLSPSFQSPFRYVDTLCTRQKTSACSLLTFSMRIQRSRILLLLITT